MGPTHACIPTLAPSPDLEQANPVRRQAATARRAHHADELIDRLAVSAFTVPTDRPEADGTLAWDRTTAVVVEAFSGDLAGLGYSYASGAAARLIVESLADRVLGTAITDHPATWRAMIDAVRNVGRPGVAATAISAVDNALWDLRARGVGLPLVELLGAARPRVDAYGSGGFTSYSEAELVGQLGGWAADGFRAVKMKVGADRAADPRRVALARRAVGGRTDLYVDANGAFGVPAALAFAAAIAAEGVSWLEEPVSSDDLIGLREVRMRAPAGMAIAAGEYAWDPFAARALLDARAIDVLQVDATRCLGTTGFLAAAAVAEAAQVPVSTHTAPQLHVHLACAARPAVSVEWFHDHVRIERLLFEGAVDPVGGEVAPDRGRPGVGLELRRPDAERWMTFHVELRHEA